MYLIIWILFSAWSMESLPQDKKIGISYMSLGKLDKLGMVFPQPRVVVIPEHFTVTLQLSFVSDQYIYCLKLKRRSKIDLPNLTFSRVESETQLFFFLALVKYWQYILHAYLIIVRWWSCGMSFFVPQFVCFLSIAWKRFKKKKKKKAFLLAFMVWAAWIPRTWIRDYFNRHLPTIYLAFMIMFMLGIAFIFIIL